MHTYPWQTFRGSPLSIKLFNTQTPPHYPVAQTPLLLLGAVVAPQGGAGQGGCACSRCNRARARDAAMLRTHSRPARSNAVADGQEGRCFE
jgi:hypothetical protein